VASFDGRFWKIETRKGKGTTYRVRWVVAGRPFSKSFLTMALAESFRAKLITARNGEGFDTETGLPDSMMRKLRDVSFFDHAVEFTASAWPSVSAKSRGSIIETLSRLIPVAVRNLPAAPDADLLRAALRKELNQGDHLGALTEDEAKAVAWPRRASSPVRAFEDASVVCDVLDALAVNLDGSPAAPEYFSRRRRVLHKALGYAVRKKRLEKNPLSKGNLPEGWTPPERPNSTLDPRAVGSPALVADMLAATRAPGSSRSTGACTTP
jgi:hypothetical protein